MASKVPWNKILIALLLLVIASALVLVIIGSWPRPITPITILPGPTASSGENQETLKERVENYSKRTDELQKIASLLLGLSTIYAIALGISAYTSVQANVDQAKNSVNKLETLTNEFQTLKSTQAQAMLDMKSEEINALQKLKDQETKALQEQKDAQTKALQDLRETQTKILDIEIRKLQAEVDKVQVHMTYATRIAIATMVSNLTLEEGIKRLQIESVTALLDLRNGNYVADPFVNLRLARLYRALNQHDAAEDVLSEYIIRRSRSDAPPDVALITAHFNRACYRSLQWRTANAGDRDVLVRGITEDLKRCFRLDSSTKKDAQTDKDFDHLHDQPWFQVLVQD
ncbi:MAG: hypothetical protein DMF72_02865 [Acidobacteria bacterium]|nr:MAG: hypothetical protein DMF72_02865 [Acidobacteriota bacterium]